MALGIKFHLHQISMNASAARGSAADASAVFRGRMISDVNSPWR
jgi:hypothetical protein